MGELSDLYDKADIRGHGRGTLLPTSSTPRKVRRLITVSCRLFRTVYRDGEPLNVAALDGNARGFGDDAPVDVCLIGISVQSRGRRALSACQKPLSLSPSGVSLPFRAKQEKWFTTRHRLLSYLTMHADCARLIPEARLVAMRQKGRLCRWPDCPRAHLCSDCIGR